MLDRGRPDFVTQRGIIRLTEIRHGQFLVESVPMQRIASHHVQVIHDEHQVAGLECPVYSTRRVADEQRPDSESCHGPHGKRCVVRRMPLVQMGPAPERDTRNAVQQAGSKHPGMPLDTHGREARNLAKRNLVTALEAIGQPP